MTTYTKAPGETLDYAFDWDDFLTAAGDTLSSFAFSLIGTGAIEQTSTVGNVGTAWVSGGADGESMILNCEMTSVGGLIVTRSDTIRVRLTSLIVEDGTGKPNSESYASVVFADTYFADRNLTAWAALTTVAKEAALRKASEYLTSKYRLAWKGQRRLTTQALDWPRVGVVTDDYKVTPGYGFFQISYEIVPVEVKKACAELALSASATALFTNTGQTVLQKTVGPITVKYDSNSSQQTYFALADSMIGIYLSSSGRSPMVKLVRC